MIVVARGHLQRSAAIGAATPGHIHRFMALGARDLELRAAVRAKDEVVLNRVAALRARLRPRIRPGHLPRIVPFLMALMVMSCATAHHTHAYYLLKSVLVHNRGRAASRSGRACCSLGRLCPTWPGAAPPQAPAELPAGIAIRRPGSAGPEIPVGTTT
ncbi:hypothetical protein HKBW3C_02369 [Candidatus Hakubella thermalkaliphila]|nr:hypothetical protein HKBW3C_02369 [Candidatus Hakubella thermalkaliphila]